MKGGYHEGVDRSRIVMHKEFKNRHCLNSECQQQCIQYTHLNTPSPEEQVPFLHSRLSIYVISTRAVRSFNGHVEYTLFSFPSAGYTDLISD